MATNYLSVFDHFVVLVLKVLRWLHSHQKLMCIQNPVKRLRTKVKYLINIKSATFILNTYQHSPTFKVGCLLWEIKFFFEIGKLIFPLLKETYQQILHVLHRDWKWEGISKEFISPMINQNLYIINEFYSDFEKSKL